MLLTSLPRPAIACLLLAALVASGWFELLVLGGRVWLLHRADSVAVAPVAMGNCGPMACPAERPRCGCCGDTCAAGADCRCGQPRAPRPPGLVLTAMDCHGGGAPGAIDLPRLYSCLYIAPAPVAATVPPHRANARPAVGASRAPAGGLPAPPDPPPRRAA